MFLAHTETLSTIADFCVRASIVLIIRKISLFTFVKSPCFELNQPTKRSCLSHYSDQNVSPLASVLIYIYPSFAIWAWASNQIYRTFQLFLWNLMMISVRASGRLVRIRFHTLFSNCVRFLAAIASVKVELAFHCTIWADPFSWGLAILAQLRLSWGFRIAFQTNHNRSLLIASRAVKCGFWVYGRSDTYPFDRFYWLRIVNFLDRSVNVVLLNILLLLYIFV